MNKALAFLFFAFAATAGLWYCAAPSPTGKDESDTPTSGKVKIVVDESYSMLFETEIYTFESLYKNAKVEAAYLPEEKALEYLKKDSCKVIIINRNLTKAEYKTFEQLNLFPIATKICEDAIALIVHPENPDTLFTPEKLRRVLSGTDTAWSQLNNENKLGVINVVFDNEGSANARYMRDSLLKDQKLQKNCFAATSNPDVIDYVSTHKNAIGIISVNWISDTDDQSTTDFLNKVRVVSVAKVDAPGAKFYKPYQAYIKTKDYAFCRDVYMINRQTRAGLGMGFVAFVAGEKGQLIILKQGLIPSIMPVRLVHVNLE
jgi:phosphate transport system substrate-binding protein